MMNLGEGESHMVEFSPAFPYHGAFGLRQQNKLDSFTRREVHQGMRGTFKTAADVDVPLAVLVERGFLRKREENSTGGRPGRHPSPTYDVNPRWAPQNAQNSGRDAHSEYFEDSETALPKDREE